MSKEKFTPGECPACGTTFERKRETQKYCSQKCTRKMNGKQQRRELVC
jgi:predicted nucleic acid-binding Zn ribbon protein